MKKITDLGKIIQLIFEDASRVIKTAESGMAVGNVGTALGTALRVGKNQAVMFYNSAGTDAFIKFGDATVTAPTAATNGLPILKNSIVYYNSGENAYVIASAATVFAYQIAKD